MADTEPDGRGFEVVDLNYISLYVDRYDAAIEFYTRVFGPPDCAEDSVIGWRMGATWLTVFPAIGGSAPGLDPRNAEFAVQLAAPAQVDRLYELLLEAGAGPCMAPRDTSMYGPMRFGCVDDPFGVRIDVYCPLPE